jgi:hypothetical protein
MALDLGGLLRQAEDYLRLHIKSKAVRAAEKRRTERQSQRAVRRLKRAGAVGGASGAGLVGYGALVAPLAGPALLAAGGAALLLTGAVLFWPSRRATDGPFSRTELAALPGEAEDWLLARREGLPAEMRPLLDRLFTRLGDLQPHLGGIAPHVSAAWEARRLLGDHLPRLILAYEALPASAREHDADVRERLATGLATLADALDALCEEVCRPPKMSFETQERFLHSRYRQGPAPGGDEAQSSPSNRSR